MGVPGSSKQSCAVLCAPIEGAMEPYMERNTYLLKAITGFMMQYSIQAVF